MWGARQIAVTAALIGAAGLAWLSASDDDSPIDDARTSNQATNSDEPIGPAARRSIGGSGELPGAATTDVPRGLDFTRPAEVARAYLVAAHSLREQDSGRTNRRVLPYLAETNPDYPRGIVVVDAPGPGEVAKTVVDRLDVVSKNQDGDATAYRARWTVSTGPKTAAAERVEARTSFVVLRRQLDGRWLVTQDTPRLQPAGD